MHLTKTQTTKHVHIVSYTQLHRNDAVNEMFLFCSMSNELNVLSAVPCAISRAFILFCSRWVNGNWHRARSYVCVSMIRFIVYMPSRSSVLLLMCLCRFVWVQSFDMYVWCFIRFGARTWPKQRNDNESCARMFKCWNPNNHITKTNTHPTKLIRE